MVRRADTVEHGAEVDTGAAAEVVLTDGRVVEGDVERRAGIYLVNTIDRGMVILPVGLVVEIRFLDDPTGEPEVQEGRREDAPPAFPAYSGPPAPPTPSAQLEAFGWPPAALREPVVDTRWLPEDVLGYETDVTQFAPSSWPRPSASRRTSTVAAPRRRSSRSWRKRRT